MNLNRTQEWWLARVDREDEQAVGAGLPARDPARNSAHDERLLAAAPAVQPAVEETRIAFGRFVSLMRRRRALSIEKLAETAELDVRDIVSIEDDLHYTPAPRTVVRLARTFNVPRQRLMRLGGLASANDMRFRQEATRFAARSESVQKLTKEENAALETFVAALSERDG